jgi:hypothetical protein
MCEIVFEKFAQTQQLAMDYAQSKFVSAGFSSITSVGGHIWQQRLSSHVGCTKPSHYRHRPHPPSLLKFLFLHW